MRNFLAGVAIGATLAAAAFYACIAFELVSIDPGDPDDAVPPSLTLTH